MLAVPGLVPGFFLPASVTSFVLPMIIPETLIEQYGGKKISFGKGQPIVDQGSEALHYYQVKSGEVKMVNYSPEGQEFIQGLFAEGESFGEPALFGEFPYPASAIASTDCEVYKLTRHHFFDLLEKNFDIHRKFNYLLSQRLQYKGMLLNEISSHPPEHRIMTLLGFLKTKLTSNGEQFEVPYTRQQLADMTGLRVETVIRAIKKMEGEGHLQVRNHKIVI